MDNTMRSEPVANLNTAVLTALDAARAETWVRFYSQVEEDGKIPEDMTGYWEGIVEAALSHAEQWGIDSARWAIDEGGLDLSGQDITFGYFTWKRGMQQRFGLESGDETYIRGETAEIIGGGCSAEKLKIVFRADRSAWERVWNAANESYLETLFDEIELQQEPDEPDEEDVDEDQDE